MKLNRLKIDTDTSYPHIVYSTRNYKSQPNNAIDKMKLLINDKVNHWIDKMSPVINQISNSVDSESMLGRIGSMFDSLMQEMMDNLNAIATQNSSRGIELDNFYEDPNISSS